MSKANAEDILKPTDYDENPSRYKIFRLVFVSDTHTKHRSIPIPDGDIFVHCGDFTNRGNWHNLDEGEIPKAIVDFNQWLGQLKHRHKIVIDGNHEIGFARLTRAEIQSKYLPNCTYLHDQSIEIEGLSIYGCSWSFDRQHQQSWSLIPNDVDILLTHKPPQYILDLACQPCTPSNEPCARCGNTVHGNFGHWGSEALTREVTERIRPRIHCFGHVHDDAGYRYEQEANATLYINAAADLTHRAMRFNFYLDLYRNSS